MMVKSLDPTKRFSNRVDNYIKYRPNYPEKILPFLNDEIGLSQLSVIADIGSGTGILSKLFLRNGNKVFCVEPNAKMRNAAEVQLKNFKNFISINGLAEQTSLTDNSIDLICAGQAFHWFNIEKSKKEFIRILKPNGNVSLIWNSRKNDASKFLESYEKLLLDFAVDYKKVDHKNINDEILKYFFKNYKKQVFPNSQKFNLESLRGRLLSSSYAPTENHPNFNPIMKELERIYHVYQKNGIVEFLYNTEIFIGKIS